MRILNLAHKVINGAIRSIIPMVILITIIVAATKVAEAQGYDRARDYLPYDPSNVCLEVRVVDLEEDHMLWPQPRRSRRDPSKIPTWRTTMRLLDWEGAKEDSYYANFHTFPSEELLETKREIAATKAKFLRQTFSPLIAPDCEDDLSTDHYNEKFRNRLEVTIQIDDHGEIYSVVMFVRGHLRQSDFQVYAIDSPSTSSVGNQFIALLFKFIQVSNGDQCMINGGRRCVNEGVGKEPRRIVYRRYL